MLCAHRQSGYLRSSFLNKKSPLQLCTTLPPLWGNLYRKSTHLWCVCANTHPLPQPARERCGPAGGWGGCLWNEGRAEAWVYLEQGQEGTLMLLTAQVNLIVVAPLQSLWSVKMLFLQVGLHLRNVASCGSYPAPSPHLAAELDRVSSLSVSNPPDPYAWQTRFQLHFSSKAEQTHRPGLDSLTGKQVERGQTSVAGLLCKHYHP